MTSPELITAVAEAEALLARGQRAEASAALGAAMGDSCDEASSLHGKAVCATVAGDYRDAARLLKMALRIRPNRKWKQDLGAVLYAGQRYLEAARAFSEALDEGAGDGEIWLNIGHSLLGTGQAHKALRAYEKAASVGADAGKVARAKARSFLRMKIPRRALELLQPLYEADRRDLRAQELMANAYVMQGRFDLGVKHCREAEQIGGGELQLRENLFSGLWLTGEVEECLEVGRSILPVASSAFHLYYLTALDHFTPDPEVSKSAWEHWNQFFNSKTELVPRSASKLDPVRVLRIGYLISEIHRFPDWHFVPPLVESRDQGNFFSIGYVSRSISRNYMKTASGSFDLVRDVRQKAAKQIAEQVAADQVDILVNPCWDQRGYHLEIFAHRPAAIQVEIPLYPATTGSEATDFIFTDKWICPDGSESIYTERVYRLEESYAPWRPPLKAPDISPAPIEQNGYCTFGLFQKAIKFNPLVWDKVAEILCRVSDSRLLIHQSSRDLDDKLSDTRRRYLTELGRRGVEPGRILFAGSRPLVRHYEIVSKVDVALDTFPYNGMTTTGDCLWMGVPVVTYAGRTHASRVGHGMLSRLGLSELVAHSAEEYVETAVDLAHDKNCIACFRQSLRDRMRGSHITSGKAVMAGIEKAYRAIWTDYCKRELELKEKA